MTLITTNDALTDLCGRLKKAPYLTVDTEFMRESTFWPKLCLVQVASPDEAVAIDPLAKGLDLGPLYTLLADKKILKVFHAARQDIEIFFHQSGKIPSPLFDTQVAAMVCGFGDSVGYETLVNKLAHARVDKSSRFTDWSRRPLTERQLKYAISDVTHLRPIYEKLAMQLAENGRAGWLDEEMAVLLDPATYDLHPERAWRRIKVRSTNPRLLGILKEVAAWREDAAQRRDQPRNRVVRDEALMEIAAHPPKSPDDLNRVRGIPRGFANGALGKGLLAAAVRGTELPEDALPRVEKPEAVPKSVGPLVELLKVLLKMKCAEQDVAQKLVASTADLEKIAQDDHAPVAALRGWRHEIFGSHALALKHGKLGLAADGRAVKLVTLEPGSRSAKVKETA